MIFPDCIFPVWPAPLFSFERSDFVVTYKSMSFLFSNRRHFIFNYNWRAMQREKEPKKVDAERFRVTNRQFSTVLCMSISARPIDSKGNIANRKEFRPFIRFTDKWGRKRKKNICQLDIAKWPSINLLQEGSIKSHRIIDDRSRPQLADGTIELIRVEVFPVSHEPTIT